MKLKNQLSIFNVITRLLLLLVLVLLLPIVVEQVVYKHINKTLLEKKTKFIEHLNNKEINEFINQSVQSDTYASFSLLHDEFILLSKLGDHPKPVRSVFVNEPRIIEKQQDKYRILQYNFNYDNKSYQLEVGSSLGEITDLTFMIRVFMLVTLLVIVLITFVIDSLFIDFLLKPFYRIIDTKIRRVNDPDSFNVVPIASHSADFRELDEVLNQMMQRIEGHFKQEKQFIANVSHELLTPISLLKNRFENLIQNESLDDVAVDKIVSSLRTLDLLKRIINNLLLISKIENNQFTVVEQVDINELIVSLAEDLSDRVLEKGIGLSIKLDHHFDFNGNRTLLHILIFNLLSNAIKYNKPNGTIVIRDQLLDKSYCLSIKDTGNGMTAAQTLTIFDRFTRLDTGQEGQGLGLAIVDSIAHFHHIAIEVDSIPDEGTEFRISFPLK